MGSINLSCDVYKIDWEPQRVDIPLLLLGNRFFIITHFKFRVLIDIKGTLKKKAMDFLIDLISQRQL